MPPSLPPVRGPTALWFPPLYSTNTPAGTPFRNQTSYFWMFLQVTMVVQSGGQITAARRERGQRRPPSPPPGLDTGRTRLPGTSGGARAFPQPAFAGHETAYLLSRWSVVGKDQEHPRGRNEAPLRRWGPPQGAR
ncbi:hypothetical protein GCM10025782_12390 [Pedococcus ginsenosidimutans]|uniref:Uncharacterized protein n=1 Tax=Pedococcus ginsenosidimutans TaxID=490570 RepID=A0ABP8XXS4_9MICO